MAMQTQVPVHVYRGPEAGLSLEAGRGQWEYVAKITRRTTLLAIASDALIDVTGVIEVQ